MKKASTLAPRAIILSMNAEIPIWPNQKGVNKGLAQIVNKFLKSSYDRAIKSGEYRLAASDVALAQTLFTGIKNRDIKTAAEIRCLIDQHRQGGATMAAPVIDSESSARTFATKYFDRVTNLGASRLEQTDFDYHTAMTTISSKIAARSEFKNLHQSSPALLASATGKPLVVLIGDIHDSSSIGQSNQGLMQDLCLDKDLSVQYVLLEAAWQSDSEIKYPSSSSGQGRSFDPAKAAIKYCQENGKSIQPLVTERLDDNIFALANMAFIAQTFMSNLAFHKNHELMSEMDGIMLHYLNWLPSSNREKFLAKPARDIAQIRFKKLEQMFSPSKHFLRQGHVEPISSDSSEQFAAKDNLPISAIDMSQPNTRLNQDFVDAMYEWLIAIQEETSFIRDESRLELISKMSAGVVPLIIGAAHVPYLVDQLEARGIPVLACASSELLQDEAAAGIESELKTREREVQSGVKLPISQVKDFYADFGRKALDKLEASGHINNLRV